MAPRVAALWRTWDEPDRDVAVAQWTERSVCVVFPLAWAARWGQARMITLAKDRIKELEGKTGRTLAPGSVLLAFSRHADAPAPAVIDPGVTRDLRSLDPRHPMGV